jgi:hypothetical protein
MARQQRPPPADAAAAAATRETLQLQGMQEKQVQLTETRQLSQQTHTCLHMTPHPRCSSWLRKSCSASTREHQQLPAEQQHLSR